RPSSICVWQHCWYAWRGSWPRSSRGRGRSPDDVRRAIAVAGGRGHRLDRPALGRTVRGDLLAVRGRVGGLPQRLPTGAARQGDALRAPSRGRAAAGRRGAMRSVAGLAALLAAASNIAAAQGSSVAFVNVTVVPMDSARIIPAQTVIVRGGRIVTM